MPTRKIRMIYQRRKLSPEELAADLSSIQIKTSSKDFSDTAPRHHFDDMGLKPELLQGVYNYGLEKPAAIQELAIVPGTNGKDLILQAQSGMGKTVAMAVITLQQIQHENPACQAMVLVPTRELARQVGEVFVKLTQFMKVKSAVYIGGTRKSRKEHEELARLGIQVIIGTLGRLANIIRESIVDPLALKIFVMDEADKMLTDGSFRLDLKTVISSISPHAQVILMSATMPKTALRYATEITRNAKQFLIPSYQLTLEGIKQFYVNVGDNDDAKLDTLHELLPIVARKQTLIFCNSRKRVRSLFKKLIDRRHVVGSIEGEQQQSSRLSILDRFRRSAVSTLISSELLGRGIDVQQVFVVINYDLPDKVEEYIHRVGRAGRYGRNGIAITFMTDQSQERMADLEKFYQTKIDPMPVNIADYIV